MKQGHSGITRNTARAAAWLACCAALGGCIERRIQITSEPPGATVWLNDVEIGTTPTEAEFRYFGVYDVRLHKTGFEPVATHKKAEAPFYEYPGPDLIAEAIPGTNETVIKWHFTLEPAKELQGDPRQAEDQLIQRAREMGAMVSMPEPKADAQPSVRPAEGTPAEAKPAPESGPGAAPDPAAPADKK